MKLYIHLYILLLGMTNICIVGADVAPETVISLKFQSLFNDMINKTGLTSIEVINYIYISITI